MSRKIKLYGAVAGVLALSIAGFAIVRALTSVDSNIATVTTRSASQGGVYIGQCITKSTSTIAVSWTRSDITSPAMARLYGSNALDGVKAATSPLTESPAPGSYEDSNLAPSTQRWYRVDTVPDAGNPTTGAPFTCTTKSIISDVPTKLGIFANSDNTLFFNWKDNATSTAPYNFEVQRIRVTPETPSSTATSSPVLAHEVSFKWAVEGTSTPYQTMIERSTSTNTTFRFSKDAAKDPSFKSFPTGQWNNPSTTKKFESFIYSDISVEDAMVYYYRFKICSLIQVVDLYAKEITGFEQFNDDITKPSPACSTYKPTDAGMTIMTPPAPPSDFAATASSTSVINLRWVNHSVNADGYEIQRSEGSPANYTLLKTVDKNTTSTRDTGLHAGTHYYYRIRSYKDFGGGVKLYSTPTVDWITANAYTWFTVTASVTSSNGGQGSVDSSPSGISCSSSCSASFPWGTSVTMSATPVNSDSVFEGWSGDCGGASCTVSANADVTARFSNLCAGVSCLNKCIGSTFNSGGYCSAGDCFYSTQQNNSPRCTVAPVSCTTNADCAPYCGGTDGFTYFSNGTCATNTCNYASSTPNSPLCGFVGVKSPGSSNVALQTEGVDAAQETKGSLPSITLTATIADAMKDVGGTIWESLRLAWNTLMGGVDQLVSFFEKQIPVAEGQSTSIDYDAYFAQASSTVSIPSKKDIGLRSDTVYLYRVRVDYGGGRTSAWSVMIAGKTLGEDQINKVPGIAGVCINNSYCQQVITEVPKYERQYIDPGDPTKTLTEHSELQCTINAHCREVGRSSQTFEEQ